MRALRVVALVGIVAVFAGLAGWALFASNEPSEPPPPLSDRLDVHPRGTTSADNGYLAYLPPGYGDGVPRPLLVFWHGSGENGDGRSDLPWVAKHGPPGLVDQGDWPAHRDWLVLSPQHDGRGCPTSSEIHAFFEHAVATYDVDPERVYLTGLSCGAIGAWAYLAEHGNAQVAAAVLIAGHGVEAVAQAGCAIARVPIWVFHGDADSVVEVAGAVEAMAALTDCPSPDRRRLTVYEGVDHDSWSMTYDGSAGHDIYGWMAGFSRSDP